MASKPRGWSTNWSVHQCGVPQYEKVHAMMTSPLATIKMSDSLVRAPTYVPAMQRSAVPNNYMSVFPLELRVPTPKNKNKFRPPKLTRVRLPHIVIEFNERLRKAALNEAGPTGNIKLGLLRMFVQNDEDGLVLDLMIA
jgi:hypothetical protein